MLHQNTIKCQRRGREREKERERKIKGDPQDTYTFIKITQKENTVMVRESVK